MTDQAEAPQRELAAESERAVIGSLLLDRDAIGEVADWLRPEAFYDQRTRKIYATVLELWHERVPADVVTVGERGGEDFGYLTELMLAVPTAVHVTYYAEQVMDAARRRSIASAGAELVRRAYLDKALDVDTALAEIRATVDIFKSAHDDGPVPYADFVPDWRTAVIDRWEGRTPSPATRTGFRDLDDWTGGGINPSELCVVAARPGVGKTAFMLQQAHNATYYHRDRLVLIFSAEMSYSSLVDRAVAELSGFTVRQVRTGDGLSMAEKDRILAASERLERMPVRVDDTASITTAQIEARIKREQVDGHVGLVLIDYLELLGDSVRSDNEERRVGTIALRTKQIAKTCNVPVVLLSQLSRAVESRSGEKRPTLADLRYSGSIEASADMVWLLYRYQYYVEQGIADPDPERERDLEVIVAKHRNGKQGTAKLRFDSDVMRIGDWP